MKLTPPTKKEDNLGHAFLVRHKKRSARKAQKGFDWKKAKRFSYSRGAVQDPLTELTFTFLEMIRLYPFLSNGRNPQIFIYGVPHEMLGSLIFFVHIVTPISHLHIVTYFSFAVKKSFSLQLVRVSWQSCYMYLCL